MRISGRTRITGIFGFPIEHTLSPAMHNAAFEALGLDYCYVPFLVPPDLLGDAVRSIRALGIAGVNVTVPHKEKVMLLLDEVDEEASFIGAVNTIVNAGGRLKGHNTDGRGFMQSLAEKGISVKGASVLIIGAGGAARAVGYYLCGKAGGVFIHGRTKDKVERLVRDLGKIRSNAELVEDLSGIGRFDLVINATPLGLKDSDPMPLSADLLTKGQIVCDLIYRETALLREASKKGCVTVNGLGMLLWQGVEAFQLWTGKRPDVEVMRQALTGAINQ
ncbi:MAG: shikimate dehydrogenase [Nitrospirota bacterium]